MPLVIDPKENNSTRRFWGKYRIVDDPSTPLVVEGCARATGTCPQPNPATGTNVFYDGWFAGVTRIADMKPGETRWTRAGLTASFGLVPGAGTPTWTFAWCNSGAGAVPPAGVTLVPPPINGTCGTNGSQMVKVTRTDSLANTDTPTWEVYSDPTPDQNGNTFVGDISELIENASNYTKFHGLYDTRFRLTVTCISDCQYLPTP